MTSNRSGATLTEVLMSVLIMSIGVASVATLFPISVKRAVIATQLTNATILRNNADAFVDAFPNTIHDPDGDGDPTEHYGGVITPDNAGNYSRPTTTAAGSFRNGRYVIDPLGFLNTDFTLDNFTAADDGKLRSAFGNVGNGAAGIPRYTLSSGTLAQKEFAVRAIAANFQLPDSWVTEYDGLATITFQNGFGTKFVLDADEGMSTAEAQEIATYGDPVRFVFFDDSLKQGEVRGWTTPNAGEFTISPPLPNNGRYGTVAPIKLQRLEPRYTYLLTVRKRTLQHANVDVVIVFRRSFSYQDELAFDATIATHVDHDGDANTPGVPNRIIRGINFGQHNAVLDGGPEVRRGAFVMDIENARWYRIQDLDLENGTITVDSPLIENGAVNTQTGLGHVMFMPRVIDVFPLGTKALKGF